MSRLRRFAAGAPAPVLPLFGPAGRRRTQGLHLTPGVEVALSPRHASHPIEDLGERPELGEPPG